MAGKGQRFHVNKPNAFTNVWVTARSIRFWKQVIYGFHIHRRTNGCYWEIFTILEIDSKWMKNY